LPGSPKRRTVNERSAEEPVLPDREAPPSVDLEELAAAVRSSAMSVALADLRSLRVVALSARGAEMLGLTASSSGSDVLSLVTDPDAARAALESIRSGAFDAYEAHRQLRRGDGELVESIVWVRVVDAERTRAVAVLVEADGRVSAPASTFADVDATVGTLDEAGFVRQISADVTTLLGYAPAAFVGMVLANLVHPDDVGALLDVFERVASENANLAIDVRVRAANDAWLPVHLTVSALAGAATKFGFAAVAAEPVTVPTAGGPTDRIAELERHLTRIAREVEAAGLIGRGTQIPDPDRVPGLGDLTSRQWQILTRLLRGERVPGIARAMYLSQSTIRNYLSAIYRKLGVHSQAELIERFHADE
jgi:PAS domain S-box-containing protein